MELVEARGCFLPEPEGRSHLLGELEKGLGSSGQSQRGGDGLLLPDEIKEVD